MALPVSHHQFLFDHLDQEHGMDEQRVFSIVEGDDGAIWISTKNGVKRYNGHRIDNYDLPAAMRLSDASGRMFKMHKAGNRLFTFDNTGKIFEYHPLTDQFSLFRNLPEDFGGGLFLNDICVDRQGLLWVATSNGLYLVGSSPSPITLLDHTSVNTILDEGDIKFVGTNSGAYSFSTPQSAASQDGPKPSPNYHPTPITQHPIRIESLYYDEKTGILWLGTFNSGVQFVNIKSRRPMPSPLDAFSHNPVRCITPLSTQSMLLGVDGGGVWLASRDGLSVKLLMSADDETGSVLHGNGIYDICRDRWGDLWIGSYSGGVDIAYPMGAVMQQLKHIYMNPQSPANDDISAVMQDSKGNIWLGTDMGMSIFSPDGQWHHGLAGKVVLSFCERPDGTILAGTYGAGVYAVRPDGSSRLAYGTEKHNLLTNYVFSLFVDRAGSVWIGCLDGPLVELSAHGRQEFNIPLVQAITSSPSGLIAVGTAEGLYLVNPTTHQYTHHFHGTEFGDKDVNFFVQAILFIDDDHVWLGTDGGGIYIYDIPNHRFQNLTTSQGLPSNNVYALGFDDTNRIWASTDKGLVYLVPGKQPKVVNVNFIAGLEREYRRQSMTALSDGTFIFGATNGAVILNPKLISELNYKAPLRFHGISILGHEPGDSTLRQHLYAMLADKNVKLNYSQNSFDITFESINYPYQNDIIYEYQLEGSNPEWVRLGSSQTIHLTRLSSGNYQLHVRSISRNGGKVLDTQTLNIHIAAPWWNSWWAWCIYLLLFGNMIYLLWRRYQSMLESRYFNEKAAFFINTAHDIRTPLTLVLAPLDNIAADESLSSTSRYYLDMARKNGEKLRKKISGLLDFQQADHLGINLHVEELNLRTLLESETEKFKVAARQKNQSLQLLDCPEHTTVWFDPFMADSIFENLISNAIKYTPDGGSITLKAVEQDDNIRIEVRDTGIGIPKTADKRLFQDFYRADNARKSKQQGTGIGLMLVRRFIQLHQGSLSYTSREGKGTVFVITLKKGNTHLGKWIDDKSRENTAEHHPATASAAKSIAMPPTNGSNQQETLLFVDDNAELRTYIATVFANDYRVVTADSAETALNYLETESCDIMVSDVMMPGMQGDELCRKLKNDRQTSWIPIILLTAKAGRDFMIEGLDQGADDYIEKPFDSGVLRSKINSILTNRKRLQTYYMELSRVLVNRQQDEARTQTVPSVGSDNNLTVTAPPSSPDDTLLDPSGKEFVEQATQLILDNLKNSDFNINTLCREMAMSRTLFYGKLKSYTGRAPQEFMRTIRLERAAALLRQGVSVSETATRTGFANTKYFSTVFRKQFGTPPSQYQQ
jgi:signal transduction histidine kinase/CheY-like chemotaxis protein/ligand-binding sensor domain-containing protein/AraC-like DNA-binding protein